MRHLQFCNDNDVIIHTNERVNVKDARGCKCGKRRRFFVPADLLVHKK